MGSEGLEDEPDDLVGSGVGVVGIEEALGNGSETEFSSDSMNSKSKEQGSDSFSKAFDSRTSTVRLYLTFIFTQLEMYEHLFNGGSQSETSRSPLERLRFNVTAIRASGDSRSFANLSRCALVHRDAPERQASARGIKWSISNLDGLLYLFPS